MTGTEAHCHQHPFYLFIAASTFGLHLCFGDGCFRRCVAQFCDMFEYTNPVRGVQAKNSWLKISVKTSVRSSPPPSEAFSISLAFQLLQEKRHYGVPLNCQCCGSLVSSGRVQRKCSCYFTQRMYVDRTGAPGRGSYETGLLVPPPFLFLLLSLSLTLYLRKWGTCHWLVLVPHVLYSQGSDHIWCFSCVYS